MRKNKIKFFDKLFGFWEPFHLFYLGFLASIGLAFGWAMVINLIRRFIELQYNLQILIYFRIIFVISYLSLITFTYKLLDMKKYKSLRNGFILFSIVYILGEIYIWIGY